MKIFVGSENPVKINAVITASSESWPEVQVTGIAVLSEIAEQPLSDEETRQGAYNRAKNVLQRGLQRLSKEEKETEEILGIGLEGGVFQRENKELWSTVWVCVVDTENKIYETNGARFKVPQIIADRILAGEEMGPVMGSLFADPQLKQKQGAIGVITKGFVDRTEEYTIITKLALGLYFGRGWETEITST